VAEELRPQIVPDAPTHPRFKYFSETGEDLYRSFLGCPWWIADSSKEFSSCKRSRRARSSLTKYEWLPPRQPRWPHRQRYRVVHEVQLQAERLRVVQVTMRTVQDIVNNCLNQLQLFRMDAEGYLSEDSLRLFDRVVRTLPYN